MSQRGDGATGLDYYLARYYDPASGTFTSADTVLPGNGLDPAGLDRYAYVEDNPETHVDSNGHCWPLCTMIIGAVIGAAVGAATSVVSQVASGQKINWHEVGKQAAIGAVAGAISGLAGPEAGPFVRAAVDGVASAAGQMVGNAIDGKPLTDGVLEAGVEGAAMSVGLGAVAKVGGKLLKGAGTLIHSAGEETEADASAIACNLSFSYETKVATPSGEQKIGTLKVGDTVLAYDPQTKRVTAQTVQHVWINHDNDLIDLKLRTEDAPASDGVKPQLGPDGLPRVRAPPQGTTQSQTTQSLEETVHTTAKHPFLTLEQGWVKAGQLQPGMHVIRADGRIGVVEVVVVVPGTGTMYNLEVSKVHTFEVGLGRWVVHNCGVNDGVDYPKRADAEANALHDGLGPKLFRKFGTVGVAFVEENGAIRRIVTTSRQLSNGLKNKIKQQVGKDFYEDALGGLKDHAEDFLLRATNGKNVLGIGTSNDICTVCEPNVLSSSGGRWPRHLFGSGFMSDD